jgi:hypothetical protein
MVKYLFVNTSGNLKITPPMSVFSVLRKGLDVISADPILVLPPILLDLFLWFGPRLSSTALFRRMAAMVEESIQTAPVMDPDLSLQMMEQLELFSNLLAEFGARFNLLWWLSSYPAIVPSSMVGFLPFLPGRMPLENPLGTPVIIEIPLNIPLMVLVLVPICIVGLAAGTLYYRWIVKCADPESDPIPFFRGWIRIMLFTALLSSIGFISGFGLLFVVGLINILFGQQVGILLLGLGLSILLGVFIYLFFTPYSIILGQKTIFRSVLDSFNVVRVNMLGTLFFLFTAGGLLYLTNIVWLMPQDNSWYTLLGIIGHGFISAVLIAAGFIFLKDRLVFIEELREKLFKA